MFIHHVGSREIDGKFKGREIAGDYNNNNNNNNFVSCLHPSVSYEFMNTRWNK